MKIAIIGAKGNMGRRYSAILNAMNVYFYGIDEGDRIEAYDYAIVATPTNSHIMIINDLLEKNEDCHILCEKPFTTNITELTRFFGPGYKKRLCNLKMVNNYEYAYKMAMSDNSYVDPTGHTRYEYYNTGNDGLLWDCIQLIKMAQNGITISRKNYFWSVTINGYSIDRRYIDHSYCHMIKDFITDQMESQDLDQLYNLHLFIGQEDAKRSQRDLFSNDREYWSASANDFKKVPRQSVTDYG